MKLSFQTVCLIFVVTLAHLAIIASIYPTGSSSLSMEQPDLALELDWEEIDETLEPEQTDIEVTVENAETDPVEADLTARETPEELENEEPVALRFDPDRFREAARPPEVANVDGNIEQENVGNADSGDSAHSHDHSSNPKEIRAIEPIPRS